MLDRQSTYLINLLFVALFGLALTACGGGGGGNGGGSGDPGGDGSGGGSEGGDGSGGSVALTFLGSLVDGDEAAVDGVLIEVALGSEVFSDETDADGEFEITVPAEDAADTLSNGLTQVAVTGSKVGYQDWVAFYTEADEDPQSVFTLSEPGVILALAGSQVPITPLDHEGPILHLGDDVFGGDINSELQTSTQGATGTYTFTLTEEQMLLNTLVLQFVNRGVERETTTIAVQENSGTGEPVGQVIEQPMPLSDFSGEWTEQAVEFDLPTFLPRNSGNFTITITTVEVEDPPAPDNLLDDFEITNMVLELM